MIVWITGRPKAGKTTLAYKLRDLLGNGCVILDGDELRSDLDYTDFTKDGRCNWMNKVGNLALRFSKQGFVSVVALVSPYSEERLRIRRRAEENGSEFILIYLDSGNEHMWVASDYEEPVENENAIALDKNKREEYYEGLIGLYSRCIR